MRRRLTSLSYRVIMISTFFSIGYISVMEFENVCDFAIKVSPNDVHFVISKKKIDFCLDFFQLIPKL